MMLVLANPLCACESQKPVAAPESTGCCSPKLMKNLRRNLFGAEPLRLRIGCAQGIAGGQGR